MKKTTFTSTALIVLTFSLVTGCSSPSQKVENAEQEVIDANIKLDQDNEDYKIEIDQYRLETDAKIAANNKSVADFNARKENDKIIAKAEYKAKIAALEQKNTDMKKRMDEYKADGKDSWETFKAEFNRDMDELGQAFRDLTIVNK